MSKFAVMIKAYHNAFMKVKAHLKRSSILDV